MKKHFFLKHCYKAALQASEAFGLNPVVILAQSALESGWGTSNLARNYNSYFGITAYGKPNAYWNGGFVELGNCKLKFRCYDNVQQSFFDYARLIRSKYPAAAAMSFHPEAFAKEIAYSPYISEVNGDNREQYRKTLVSLCRSMERLITEMKTIYPENQLAPC